MGRLRDWLVNKYLPAWAVQTILEENKQLHGKLEHLKEDYKTLQAYTDGLEYALHRGTRIEINTTGGGLNGDRSAEGTDR